MSEEDKVQGDQAPQQSDPVEGYQPAALHARLDAAAVLIEAMMQRIKTLESWMLKLDQRKPDRSAWDAPKPKQTLGAGIGQAIPKARSTVVRLSPEATEYVPTEDPHG